jgi:ABC-type uncharacterized transport system fused permease/ATPase subunit
LPPPPATGRRPLLALLDEATSSISPPAQAAIYAALKAAGVTIVSLGHDEALRGLHDMELQLAGDGSGAWRLR